MLIETRRVPASSHPAIRDMAKTYVLQRLLTRPWRRAKRVSQMLADVPIWRNLKRIGNTLIVREMGYFLKAEKSSCG